MDPKCVEFPGGDQRTISINHEVLILLNCISICGSFLRCTSGIQRSNMAVVFLFLAVAGLAVVEGTATSDRLRDLGSAPIALFSRPPNTHEYVLSVSPCAISTLRNHLLTHTPTGHIEPGAYILVCRHSKDRVSQVAGPSDKRMEHPVERLDGHGEGQGYPAKGPVVHDSNAVCYKASLPVIQ